MAKIVNLVFDEIDPNEAQRIEDACVKLEDAGYTVYSEMSALANPAVKHIVPRPKRPV